VNCNAYETIVSGESFILLCFLRIMAENSVVDLDKLWQLNLICVLSQNNNWYFLNQRGFSVCLFTYSENSNIFQAVTLWSRSSSK